MEIIFLLLAKLIQSFWLVFQILFIFAWMFFVKRFKFSGQKTALFGFMLLFMTMIFNLFGADIIAGKIAEFVWILFAIAFVQEFRHFLKYENK